MPTASTIEAQFLVLRKTPYAETSLIVAGISPSHGQLHFLVRGGRRTGRRQFPLVDIFRLLRVQFRPGRGELYTWQAADAVAEFSGVASYPVAFRTAAWLAAFALGNVEANTPNPRFFRALCVALKRLSELAGPEAVAPLAAAAVVGTALVFLDENGLLAHYTGDPQQEQRRELLLNMGHGDCQPPTLSLDDWHRLRTWAVALLHHSDSRVPPIPWASPPR